MTLDGRLDQYRPAMKSSVTAVEEGRFRGEPCLTITAGQLSATFLPSSG